MAAIAAFTAGSAAAQSPGGWSSAFVPGGSAALLTAAGLDPGRLRTTVLLDVIRAVHELPEGLDKPLDERRLNLYGYLETISEFERIRRELGGSPCASPLPPTRTSASRLRT